MAVLKTIKRNHRSESLRGRFMVDTVRGVLRIRKWPKKRGTPKSASQLYWIDWFRQANRLAKYVDAATMRRAIDITKGSGMYPRDYILKAMRGRLYVWQDQFGKVWYPMAAVQDISESLDVLAQKVGSLLVRTGDRWRDVAPGNPGDVLTHGADGTPPEWQPAAGGGGFSGGALVEKTSDQVIPSGANTVLTWNAEVYDTAGLHDDVTNNSRIVVPADTSWITLNANVRWTSNSSGSRILRFRKNGDAVYPGAAAVRVNAYTQSMANIQSPVLAVSPGDYFEAEVYQNSGANRSVVVHSETHFSMQLL